MRGRRADVDTDARQVSVRPDEPFVIVTVMTVTVVLMTRHIRLVTLARGFKSIVQCAQVSRCYLRLRKTVKSNMSLAVRRLESSPRSYELSRYF